MALFSPEKYNLDFPNINEKLIKLKGELDSKTAKITLAEFLRYNLGFTVELIAGMKLYPYQEILLKAFFNRNFSLAIVSRGGAKSMLAAVLSFLIPLFEKNTNILVAGPTFRTSRHIFGELERIVKSPDATLLAQAMGAKPSKRNDLFEWEINGGVVRAIPLNGEKIRGFRAQVLILDEFLLLSEDIIKTVLMPFLIVPANQRERITIRENENEMIAKGLMTEKDRKVFPNTSRMIGLSSASYTFENLYRVYTDWIEKITSNMPVLDAKYFVGQIGYEALPKDLVSKTIIEEAKEGGNDNPAFLREYGARFIDGSESYFSAKKMHELTILDGQKPTVKIAGNPNKKYILSIDPSFSESPTSDYFAMAVAELDEEDERKFTLVHNYAKAGTPLGEHIKYFLYLLKSFNIVMVIADNADGNFIQSCNESVFFRNELLKLDFIDYDGELSGDDYIKMLKTCRNQYNQTSKIFCFKHVFNKNSIRRINEQLQTYINTNKVRFASKITANDEEYANAVKTNIPYEFPPKSDGILDFISNQDDLIYQVKKQCTLIEVKISPEGSQTFDLPLSLKKDSSPNRARKDNYTALMLLVEGIRAYNDVMKCNSKGSSNQFTPKMIGKSTYRR